MTAEPLWPTPTRADAGVNSPAVAPSFEALYRDHHARLHRFCLGMTRHDPAAEDIAQETLLRAFLHWDELDPERPAWPWLKKVATRLVYDYTRSQRRVATEIADEQIAPDTAGVYADREIVRQMIGTLPERQRAAVTLRYLDDWKSAEIAAVLNLPRSAVEQLLLRARRSLKSEYRRLSGDRLRLALWPLLGWSMRVRHRMVRGAEAVGDFLPTLATTAESMTALAVAGALTIGGLVTAGGAVSGGESTTSAGASGYGPMHVVGAVATAPSRGVADSTVAEPLRTAPRATSRMRATAAQTPRGSASTPATEHHVDIQTSGATITEDRRIPESRTSVRRDRRRDRLVLAPLWVEPHDGVVSDGAETTVYCDSGSTVARAACDTYDTVEGARPSDP